MVGGGVREELECVCGMENVDRLWLPLRRGQDWNKEQLGVGVGVGWNSRSWELFR